MFKKAQYKESILQFIDKHRTFVGNAIDAGYGSKVSSLLILSIRQEGLYSPKTATPDIWRSVKNIYFKRYL